MDGLSTEEYYILWRGILNSLPVKAGDIVFIENQICYSSKENFSINLMDIFSTSHNEDFYFDATHFTPAGNRMIAEKLFEALVNQGVFDKAHSLINSPRYVMVSIIIQMHNLKSINAFSRVFTIPRWLKPSVR